MQIIFQVAKKTAEKSSRSLAQGDASHVYYLGGAAATMPLLPTGTAEKM